MKRYLWITIAVVAFIVIFFGGALVTLYTDSLWFSDLGYHSLFSKILWTRILLTIVFTAVFFIIAYSNLAIARKISPPTSTRFSGIDIDIRDRLTSIARQGLGILLLIGALIVAILVGLQSGSNWDTWLKFANATSFNLTDPIFHLDIGFYVFKLPFWSFLYNWLFFTLIVTTLAVGFIYYTYGGIDFLANTPRFSPGVKTHLAILISLMFFLKAVGYRLAMYQLLQSPGDLFYGAGYTDVHARIPALWILLIAAIIGGIAVLLNIYRRGILHTTAAFAGLITLSLLVGAGYPALVDQFVVKPSALQKQRPYIANAVKYTRTAFHIDDRTITAREFPYTPSLSQAELQKNSAAVTNLRLWDYEPLQSTYQQSQEFQQYYGFPQVDIDRYTIGGNYRQIMLSARELTSPPSGSQSWVNQHLRYTHGYGYVMSPVNEVTTEGLPVYFASGIPTTTVDGLKLTVPQVYFGQATSDYVLVNTGQKEFDYPGPSGDVETNYTADSGPAVGGFLRRLAFAARFADTYILISGEVKPTSRILFRRNITERLVTLFPFLTLDNDPYLVTVNDKLYWLQDAYSTSDQYPYSEIDDNMGVNYIRNSVKIITDAYTGKVQAYISDPTDPVIATWSKIFPGTFKRISQMPKEFLPHLRYPEDLFTTQARVYAKYHMTNPDTFFSNTDLWRLPQISGSDGQNSQELEPYYAITRLPNSQTDEFLLIAPFVRAEKENMVAWMAAKCDPQDYGRLIVYEFPRGTLVYGPSQIKSRADQDTRISEQLTLWNQLGSSVVRGKLLAIPIENSILYVEPLYLQSTTIKIPEFKRVIVALGDKITMQPNLQQAVAEVAGVSNLPIIATNTQPTGSSQPTTPPSKPTAAPQPIAIPATAPPDVQALAKQASEQFNRAQQAQRNGDWAAYGRELDGLKKTLGELNRRTTSGR